MKNLITLLVMCSFMVACTSERTKKMRGFELALETHTGQSYVVAKEYTKVTGYIVFKNESTGEFTAYNLEKWDRKTMTTLGQYLQVSVEGVDIVRNLESYKKWIESGHWATIYETQYVYGYNYLSECACYDWGYSYQQVDVGSEWVDTSRWHTFYTGGGFTFNNASGHSKDLETMAALEEAVAEKFVAHRLSSEFSLSDARAGELAKLALRYQKLESTRELTATEKDRFALDALGVSMTQIETSLKDKARGNETAYKELLAEAARVNKTTPEEIGRFFDQVILEEALD